MPDKPLTVLTYAASASLAAVALIYFFNPSYITDGDGSANQLSRRARINSVIGLYNPANDCFINSTLQALAGLGELRQYLIRELHRRELDKEKEIYRLVDAKEEDGKPFDRRKAQSLLDADVTQGLKDMLDRLNERPTQKKIISATAFIQALEYAFATRINRQQQDAHELLQLVGERLADEYTAGRTARERIRKAGANSAATEHEDAAERVRREGQNGTGSEDERAEDVLEDQNDQTQTTTSIPTTLVNGNVIDEQTQDDDQLSEEDGFPMEGQTKSQIECQQCHFIPKSTPSPFIMLTLSVPHTKTSSSLSECFDGLFKTEYIDDYRCDRCRLVHAVSVFERDLSKTKDATSKQKLESQIRRLKQAIDEDPENPPEDIQLPDSKTAPASRIARSVAITSFPNILVVHLSRSSYDPSSFSSKVNGKVVFPEHLPLGGLLNRRQYRLLGLITHKGSHHSGHYETFRRQHSYPAHSAHSSHGGTETQGSSAEDVPQPLSAEDSSATDAPSSESDSQADRDSERITTSKTRNDSTATAIPVPSAIPINLESQSQSRSDSPSTIASDALPASPRDSLSTIPTPSSALHPHPHPLSESSVPDRTDTPASLDVLQKTDSPSDQTTRTSSRQRVRDKIEEVKEQKMAERRRKMEQRQAQRWWRISDDKVKECKTADVLGMQREGYLLFYEIER